MVERLRIVSIFGAIVYKRFMVIIWASNMSLKAGDIPEPICQTKRHS